MSCVGVLYFVDDDCERPIRLWLTVLAGVFGFHVAFLIVAELISQKAKKQSGSGAFYLAINSMVQSFTFLWILVGIVWITDDYDECKDDFLEGFTVTLIVICIYLGILALITVGFLLLTCIVCLGSWQISKFTKEVEK